MRLRARVRENTGATVHRRAQLVGGVVVPGEKAPTPALVEIAEAQKGFFLLRYDLEGTCVADTWHSSITEAKEQAKFEYAIDEQSWEEVDD